jgi:hypothetical protein
LQLTSNFTCHGHFESLVLIQNKGCVQCARQPMQSNLESRQFAILGPTGMCG